MPGGASGVTKHSGIKKSRVAPEPRVDRNGQEPEWMMPTDVRGSSRHVPVAGKAGHPSSSEPEKAYATCSVASFESRHGSDRSSHAGSVHHRRRRAPPGDRPVTAGCGPIWADPGLRGNGHRADVMENGVISMQTDLCQSSGRWVSTAEHRNRVADRRPGLAARRNLSEPLKRRPTRNQTERPDKVSPGCRPRTARPVRRVCRASPGALQNSGSAGPAQQRGRQASRPDCRRE